MIAAMYERLFEPYTGDGHTLEATLKYLTNLSVQKGISSEAVELAFNYQGEICGLIVESGTPQELFHNPQEDRTKLFLSQILKQ